MEEENHPTVQFDKEDNYILGMHIQKLQWNN